MSSLGINVGHTGGSMMAEAMLATRGVSAIKGGIGGVASHFSGGRGGGGSGGGSGGDGAGGFMAGGLAGAVSANSRIITANSSSAAVKRCCTTTKLPDEGGSIMVAGTLTEAQKELVVENMKIVDWHVYNDFTANPTIAGFTQEDLRQTGYLALCIAALHYNGTVEFETFAQVVVRNCLAEYCSKILPEGRHLSLDVQLETEKDAYCPYNVLSAADSQNAFLTFESQELIARSKE